MTNSSKLKSLINNINWLYKSIEDNDFNNVSDLEKALLKEKVLLFYKEIENISSVNQTEDIDVNSINEFQIENEIEETIENVTSQNNNFDENETAEDNIEEVIANNLTEENIDNPESEPDLFSVEEIVETEESEGIVEQIEKSIEEDIIEEQTVEEENEIIKEEQVEKSIEEIAQEKRAKFEKTEAFQKQIAMPKRDMREIIDLNKSFIFKGELFENNNDKYNQFINEMNNTRTEEEAFTVMILWTEKFQWETEENKAYDLLLRAIEKRFIPII